MPITLLDTTITGVGTDGLNANAVGAASLATGAVTAAKLGYAGQILQAVSTTKRTPWAGTASAGSYTAVPGLSVSITPRATSSKILIIYTMNFDGTRSNSGGGWAIFRNGSHLTASSGDANTNNYRVSMDFGAQANAGQSAENRYYQYLDSPSTTSAVTYDIRMTADYGFAVYVNRARNDSNEGDDGRFASIITVLEISG
jgi:hypothetical protein